jgi:hypothetical protein
VASAFIIGKFENAMLPERPTETRRARGLGVTQHCCHFQPQPMFDAIWFVSIGGNDVLPLAR